MTHPLTTYRARKKLSMTEMAELAGTTRQTIHRIEHGNQTPSLKLVQRIRDATKGAVSADDFLPPRVVRPKPTEGVVA